MNLHCSLAMAVALSVSAPAWSAGGELSRVRGLDPTAAKVLDEAWRGSPTVRRMLERIERSDLIVLLRFEPRFEGPRGVTSILTSVLEARYVLVSITTLAGEADRFLLLGHELQHAVELAEAPDVRDGPAVSALYESIGWRGRPNLYETAAALEAGRAVRREMLAGAVAPDLVLAAARVVPPLPEVALPPAAPGLEGFR